VADDEREGADDGIKLHINLNSIVAWRQIQSLLVVGRLGNDVAVLLWTNANWNVAAGLGLVGSAVESAVELLGDVLTGATDWPWVDVVGIAAALSDLVGGWIAAVSQWDAEHLLLGRQLDGSLRDHTGRRAVLDVSAVESSGAADWNDDRCWVVLHWSDLRWLRLVRPLGNGTRLGWLGNDAWRLRTRWLSWSRSRTGRLEDGDIVLVRWLRLELRVAGQVLVAWLSDHITLLGEDLRGGASSGDSVVLVVGASPLLCELAADFRCKAFARLRSETKRK
jgi:hypothetical protein